MAAVTVYSDFGAQENKICHCFHFSPISHEVMGLDAMVLVFWMLGFKPAFPLSAFTLKRLFSSSSLSALWVVSSAYLRLLIFLSAIWFLLVSHLAWHFEWCTLHKSWISLVTIYSLDLLFPNFEPVPLFEQSNTAGLYICTSNNNAYCFWEMDVSFWILTLL